MRTSRLVGTFVLAGILAACSCRRGCTWRQHGALASLMRGYWRRRRLVLSSPRMATIKIVTLNLWGEQPPLARRMQLCLEGLRALRPTSSACRRCGRCRAPSRTKRRRWRAGWAPSGSGTTRRRRRGAAATRGWRSCRAFRSSRATRTSCRTPCRPSGACCSRRPCRRPTAASSSTRRTSIIGSPTAASARTKWSPPTDHRALASEMPKIWTGDFNATPDSDEIRFLRGLHTSSRPAHLLAGRVGAAPRPRRRLHLVARQRLHAAPALARARSPARLHLRRRHEARRARRGARLPHRARPCRPRMARCRPIISRSSPRSS